MAHVHELYDFTTSAFIVHKPTMTMLFLHHKKIKSWAQPGGHIELDEDSDQALWREIQEETGLTKDHLTVVAPVIPPHITIVKTLLTPMFINVHRYDDVHQHIDLCHLMLSDTQEVRNEEGKSHQIKWFTKDQLEELHRDQAIFPNIYQTALWFFDIIRKQDLEDS